MKKYRKIQQKHSNFQGLEVKKLDLILNQMFLMKVIVKLSTMKFKIMVTINET